VSTIDICYLAWNRLEFTRKTFETMLANTDWGQVGRLIVYDDGSIDGTSEYVRAAMVKVHSQCETQFRQTNGLGPVAILIDYVQSGGADLFARIDNDTMLPPGWLGECLGLLDANPSVDLLGIEARSEVAPSGPPPRTVSDTDYIGGIGLMRRRAFKDSHELTPLCHDRPASRFGFEEWQQNQKQGLRKVWIHPPLPVCLLNRVPLEPWASLSREYVAKGWQRDWPAPYVAARSDLWEWWA
jgi:glycosyltransferase involved in cell wall biosynthesis